MVSRAVAVTTDPDGRRVRLGEEQWAHIKAEHRNLRPHLRDITAAVREPDRLLRGRRPEERYYAQGVGPDTWIKVVVHYEGERGSIATAFPRSRFP